MLGTHPLRRPFEPNFWMFLKCGKGKNVQMFPNCMKSEVVSFAMDTKTKTRRFCSKQLKGTIGSLRSIFRRIWDRVACDPEFSNHPPSTITWSRVFKKNYISGDEEVKYPTPTRFLLPQ